MPTRTCHAQPENGLLRLHLSDSLSIIWQLLIRMPQPAVIINRLRLDMVSLSPGETLVISAIPFRDIKYVAIYLDETNVLQADARFEDSWLVWDELVTSAKQSGHYLLFTAVNGYADEGGWDYVQVLHREKYVEWVFSREDNPLHYIFDIQDYRIAIQNIERRLSASPDYLRLIPTHVIFPER